MNPARARRRRLRAWRNCRGWSAESVGSASQSPEPTISSREPKRGKPSLRIAPTPPGAGLPSRSHPDHTTIGPAQRDQPAPSASTSNTLSAEAVDCRVNSKLTTTPDRSRPRTEDPLVAHNAERQIQYADDLLAS